MIADNIILCPLSPSIPLSDSIRDEDPGWADLGDAPIRVEEQSAAQASLDAGADDVVDGTDEVEAQMPRGLPAPPEPSAAEIDVELWAAPKGSYSLSLLLVKPLTPSFCLRPIMRFRRPVIILCG